MHDEHDGPGVAAAGIAAIASADADYGVVISVMTDRTCTLSPGAASLCRFEVFLGKKKAAMCIRRSGGARSAASQQMNVITLHIEDQSTCVNPGLADRGYDADWIRALVNQQGAWANIPPKRNRKDPICFSPYVYRARNLVERFFNKVKQCRRNATRYDKLAANYLAFIKLAAIRIWLRAYESVI
jgi:transposase